MLGLRAAFINAYRPLFFKLKEKTRWRLSTTTVANLSAGLPFFLIEDIRRGRSIYHDFTNESLIARGFDVPRFSPEDAAHVLAHISREFDFILYEYFLTDRAGHCQDMERAFGEIEKLERFLSALLVDLNCDESLIILTSDHGNIEDLSVKTHTRNRVPTFLWGRSVSQDIDIHGFVSQGYIKSTGNNYLSIKCKEGSFEFNEAGCSFSIQLTDELRGGIQLLSRDIGDQGNNEFLLDWAYADYHYKD